MGKPHKEEKALLSWYHDLDNERKKQLLDFAEFLYNKYTPQNQTLEPAVIPRPKEEKIVPAIQRLTRTYPMLDKMKIFPKTSEIMTANMMQGKETEKAIDELEKIFREQYELYLEEVKNRLNEEQ